MWMYRIPSQLTDIYRPKQIPGMARSRSTSSSVANTSQQHIDARSDSSYFNDAFYFSGPLPLVGCHSDLMRFLNSGSRTLPDPSVMVQVHSNRRITTAATDDMVTQIAMTTQTDITTRSMAPRHRRGRRSLESRRRHSRERLRRQRYRVVTPLQAMTDLRSHHPLEAQTQTIQALTSSMANQRNSSTPARAVPVDDVIGSRTVPVPVPGAVPVQDLVSVPVNGQGWYCNGLYFPELFDIGDIEDF